jgi:hypothetical protein
MGKNKLENQQLSEINDKKHSVIQMSAIETPFQPRDATDEEIEKYPHITDKVPLSAWIVILAGAAERAAYFGIIAPWRWSFYTHLASFC